MKIIGGIIGISLVIMFLFLVIRIIIPSKKDSDDSKKPPAGK
ncbi:hypothetical protein BH10BAC4_BH10BAC4_01780 [soil metagenome]